MEWVYKVPYIKEDNIALRRVTYLFLKDKK